MIGCRCRARCRGRARARALIVLATALLICCTNDPRPDRPRPTDDGTNVGTPATTEISGYAAPSEYLELRSSHHPQGVVAVTLPLDYEAQPTKTYPLVIAFGGAGEAARAPREGALAWLRYYHADKALKTLSDNRLSTADFRNLVTPGQLQRFNKALEERPYQGVIVACPSAPLMLELDSPEYEAFLMEHVVPALQKQYRVTPGRVGVDGVSLGGARAMYFGLAHPETFASIGAVQGAFGRSLDTYRRLVEKNRDLLRRRSIQLVTSDRDSMKRSVTKMHHLLTDNDITHEYLELTGPHDYVFNQGPGVLSLLIFHDRALR